MILVEARGNCFGLLVGERGEVDANDPEVLRGLDLGVIARVLDDGTAEPRRAVPAGHCCGRR